MPCFSFRAISSSGSRLKGELEAATPLAASQLLEARGLVVVDVGTTRTSVGDKASGSRTRIRGGAIVDVTRALAGLLSAGLPLSRALAAAASVTSPAVAERLTSVRERVSHGETLASALAVHPDLFSPLYVGLVRAGERSGDLARTFERLADQLEREAELRSKLVSAAIYPTLLGIVGLSAVLLLLLFVLPRFSSILTGAGASLPRSTATLLAASALARQYWYLFLLAPAAVAAAAAWFGSTMNGRRSWANLLLAIPLVGALRRDTLAARFARMMSVLMVGGAPVISALDDTALSLADPVAREVVLAARGRIREGVSIHRAIGDAAFFPPLLSQLIALGEETGRLEEFLRKAADLFEQRTVRATTRLVALAEPIMIILLGAVVGSVALSLLQAIYGVNAGSFR